MKNMKKYRLGDMLVIKNGRDHKGLKSGNFPVLGSGGVMRYVDKFLYDKPSVLLPRKGTLSNIQYCDKPFWTVDTLYYTEVRDDLVNSYYLYHYLKQLDLKNLNTGTGVPSMTFDSYYNITVYLPPLATQRRVAEVLGNLDRKIALNREMNETLEKMAKQLYDYWFVQFDFPDKNGRPYKASGGKMIWNEQLKRDLPEGWEVGTLLDIANYTNGLACQKFRPKDNNKLPVIKIKEMKNGITAETEFVKANIPEAVKVHNGDVLFSWSASLEVMLWTGGEGGLNQHIFKVTSKNKFPRSFYYFQLLDYILKFRKIAESRKTTMGHITHDHLVQSEICIPKEVDIALKLEEKLNPIFQEIISNQQQIASLTSLRDELLPLLMNGQVECAEKKVRRAK